MARNIRLLILSVVILTALAACNNGSSYGSSPTAPPSTNPPANATTITIMGDRGANSFSPNPASVKAGSTVQWKNADSTTHHIVSDTANYFDTGNIAPGATSAAIPVNQVASYPYHCTIHPSMVGTLNVTQ